MKRGELSFLVLIALIVCGSYVLSAPESTKEALTAQAATASQAKTQEPAYKLCPPQTPTERYSTRARYPNTYQIFSPTGEKITILSLYGKSCSQRNEKTGMFVRSECRGPWDCRALEYEDEYGRMRPVTNSRYDSSPPAPCVGGGFIISAACGADLLPQPEAVPRQSAPTNQGDEIIKAFEPQPAPAAPAQQTPQAAPAEREVTSPAGSPSGPAPVIPAGSQGGMARLPPPDNAYTPSTPPQAYPSYFIPPQQVTFPSSYSPQPGTQGGRVQAPANALAPSLSPLLFGSLYPTSLSPLRTAVQLLFTPIIPMSKRGGLAQSQNPAGGKQVAVYELTPPPPPQKDFNELVLAAERQRKETLRSMIPEAGEGAATGGAGAVYAGEKMGDATSTSGASSRRRIGSTVVDIGVPVDITDPASYQPIFADPNGDWTRLEQIVVKNKLALAEAESGYAAIAAQIEALRDAQATGLCGKECDASLASLQNQLSIWQSDVDEFGAIVRKDAAPHPASPPPTVAQFTRFADSFAELSYQVSTPRSAAEAPTAVSVFEQEAVPKVPQTTSERIVTRIVQGVWNFLKSWFLPPTTESARLRASCSLFASLFGKCK